MSAMTPLFGKLNLGANRAVLVLDAPATFEAELGKLDGVHVSRGAQGKVAFAIAFVTTARQVQAAVEKLVAHADGDAILWMAYPKATSRRLQCEFNRNTGWSALGAAGYEPVRQVAIDEDWSALRFRKAEFIKAMRRRPEGALSEAGRKKALASASGRARSGGSAA